MTAIINTNTFGDFVELTTITWFQELDKVDQAARKSGLYKEMAWPAGTGDTRRFKEFDTNQYAKNKGEGEPASQSVVQMGYSKDAILVRRAENVTVTWEMRNRNKYDEAMAQFTSLPEKIAGRLDLDLSHRITFATATSYTDMDGLTVDITVGDTKALAATDHALKASSTSYRNILTGNPQLSDGSLQAMEKMIIENTMDHFGAKKTVKFDVLFTTDDPGSVNMARKLLQSTAEISGPNNGIVNVYQGKYKHVVLPRVATTAVGAVDTTKAKYWGLASSSSTSAKLLMEENPTMISPSVNGQALSKDNAEDVDTDDVTWRARGSYAICIPGAKWFAISLGDAS